MYGELIEFAVIEPPVWAGLIARCKKMKIGRYRVLTARLFWVIILLTMALTSLPWAWAWRRERAETDCQRAYAIAKHVPIRRIVIVYANAATSTIELDQNEEQP